jgi:hypothetical protein
VLEDAREDDRVVRKGLGSCGSTFFILFLLFLFFFWKKKIREKINKRCNSLLTVISLYFILKNGLVKNNNKKKGMKKSTHPVRALLPVPEPSDFELEHMSFISAYERENRESVSPASFPGSLGAVDYPETRGHWEDERESAWRSSL